MACCVRDQVRHGEAEPVAGAVAARGTGVDVELDGGVRVQGLRVLGDGVGDVGEVHGFGGHGVAEVALGELLEGGHGGGHPLVLGEQGVHDVVALGSGELRVAVEDVESGAHAGERGAHLMRHRRREGPGGFERLGGGGPLAVQLVEHVVEGGGDLTQIGGPLGRGAGVRVLSGCDLQGGRPQGDEGSGDAAGDEPAQERGEDRRCFAGMCIGLGFAWVVVVVGETVGVQTGLGAFIEQARQVSRTDLIIAGMLFIGLAGYLSDKALSSAFTLALRKRPLLPQ